MSKLTRILGLGLFVVAVAMAFGGRADALNVGDYGSVKLQWKTVPVIKLTITPNYQTGFGPTGGAGSGSTPAPGSGASLNGGIVDFGANVVQGYSYLYKYAVKAGVTTNDMSGFTLYAEGTSDLNDMTAGGTSPLDQTLYWLVSSTANNPFSPAKAFQPTGSSVGCGGTCINYIGNPPSSAIVWNYPTSTMGLSGQIATEGFDYQLRLSSSMNPDNYNVYIVYTAVGN
jgi:hypothetical protein